MAESIVELLGNQVENGEGEMVDVASLQGSGKVLGLYFSAHWCPPCRSFTPNLAKWYKKLREGPIGDKFTIVFVSSDKDEKSFKEYFAEMPWLALPFAKRDVKSTLSKKFRVSGIPTLVLVNAENGSTLTTDGRSIVSEDPEGKQFPWKPKSLTEVLYTDDFVSKDGSVPAAAVKDKVLGIYFSAHWCGPCRSFTPILIKTYNQIKADNKDFEILFVSSDKDETSYQEYYAEMPWLALPFSDSRKKQLSRMFDVAGIPCLVIIDSNGQTITTKARAAISDDPEGKNFPWHPRPVRGLNSNTASDLNDCAAVVWFNKGTPLDETLDLMKPLAEEKIASWKAANEEPKLLFYASDETAERDEEDMAISLRKFAGLTESVKLAIIDIETQKVFACEESSVDMGIVTKFVEEFLTGSLKGKPLRSS